MSPLRMLLITTVAAGLVSACERAPTSASAPVTPEATAAGSPGGAAPAQGDRTIPSLQTATIAPAPGAPTSAPTSAPPGGPTTSATVAAAPPAACPPVVTPVCPPAQVAETVVEERVRTPTAKARQRASASHRSNVRQASSRRVATQKVAKRQVAARHATSRYAAGDGAKHSYGRYEEASIAPGFREGSRSRSAYSYSYQESSRSSVRSYSEEYSSGSMARQGSGYASSYGSSQYAAGRPPAYDCRCDTPPKRKPHGQYGSAYISPPRHAPPPPPPRGWAGDDHGPDLYGGPPPHRPARGRDHESTYSRGYIGDGRAYR